MAMNSTIPSLSSYETLYGLTDYTSLSWLEQNWVAWYVWFNNPIIATGVATFLVHEIVYFGRSTPWLIIDAIPYFRKWKLQPTKVPTAEEQWACTKQVLFSHFTVELPLIWLFQPAAEFLGMSTYQVPFPTLRAVAIQIAFFFVFEDTYHFFAHQALHTGLLYKHIHKLHHKYSAPFGLAAEFAHPAEVLILAVGTIVGPQIYAAFAQQLGADKVDQVHIVTIYLWVTLRLFQAIDAHSGYDFPWSLQHILPFWSGADHHDFHHMAFTNNFSTSFRWWDKIFGTDDKYHAHKERMRKAKEAMKSATKEEMVIMEKKMMAEAEAEGLRAEAEVLRSAEKQKKP
ncbi:hypothetical protein C8J56DRAFT_1052666 [Mycena floridula]|nr:hypothetical protein C8J56DRAFT_1052666 [Mycena floridula]